MDPMDCVKSSKSLENRPSFTIARVVHSYLTFFFLIQLKCIILGSAYSKQPTGCCKNPYQTTGGWKAPPTSWSCPKSFTPKVRRHQSKVNIQFVPWMVWARNQSSYSQMSRVSNHRNETQNGHLASMKPFSGN